MAVDITASPIMDIHVELLAWFNVVTPSTVTAIGNNTNEEAVTCPAAITIGLIF